jgi:multidrug resistance efflux pump
VIDQSKLRAPGWQKVVQELLTPSPDDASFMARLLSVLGQVAGAKQAVLLSATLTESAGTPTDPRVLLVWPPQVGDRPDVEASSDVQGAARACAESGQMRVFELEKESQFYDASGGAYIVGVPMGEVRGNTRFVATLLIEQRSKQAMQTTLALVEVLAGYVATHGLRQQLKQTRAASASLDLAARLIASINTAPTFKGACLQLANDLVRQINADRVAIGWVKGFGHSGAVRVVSISDTEHIDRRMSMVQKVEAAMDECLDQEQAVVYPPPPARDEQGGEPDLLLSQAITHAHRELVSSDATLKVASLPLRIDERVVGVLTIESTGDGTIDLSTIELLQATMDLIAPVLEVRHSDDRNLALRTAASAVKAGGWLVGSKHTVWKLAALGVMGVLLASILIRVPYRVDADATIRPRVRQTVSVPFDGIVAEIGAQVEPGHEVEAGDLLVQLDTTEVVLAMAQAESELQEAQTRASAARLQRNLAEAQQADLRAAGVQARIDSFKDRLQRSTIVAPISGKIIAGDIKERIGSAVKLGDALFEIAPLNDMIVVARVSDTDIKLLTDRMGEIEGKTVAQVATKAYPGHPFDFEIETIVPLATAEEGKNAFEVRGGLVGETVWLRPGMEGLAKFDTGNRSLMGIASRRIVDTLRLWLWW